MSPSEQLLLSFFVIIGLGLVFVANGALSFFFTGLQPFGLNPLSDIVVGVCFLVLSAWVHKKSSAALALALGIFWMQFAMSALVQWRARNLGVSFFLNVAFVASVTLLLWPSFKAMRALRE
ncbi:MAG: hypothetical protein ACREOO_00725 [bacterium]